jgi:hypothetical protein
MPCAEHAHKDHFTNVNEPTFTANVPASAALMRFILLGFVGFRISFARSGDIGLFWPSKEPQNPSDNGNRQTLVMQPEWLPIKLKPLQRVLMASKYLFSLY